MNEHNRQNFTAAVWQEDQWFVAQCLEVDVASQGETEDDALANLREALELYFESPYAIIMPRVRSLQVELDAA